MEQIKLKPKVFFIMRAYNSENYIEEAIDSILNQSEKNFLFFLQDNGSTDRTKEICERYASRDDRIILFRNKINNKETEEEIKAYNDKIKICLDSGAEYYAILDSDDFYHKDFLKITYPVAKEYNADMVVCGSTFVDESGKNIIGSRIPPKLIMKDKKISEDDFMKLYGTLRPVWGKLYSTKIYNNITSIIRQKPKGLHNGADTFLILTLMNEIDTFISINKILHTYRVRKTSFYNTSIDKHRIKEGHIIFEKGVEYAKKYQVYSDKIKGFLLSIYYHHIKDLISIVYMSKMSVNNKLDYLTAIADEQLFYGMSQIFSDVEPLIFNSLDLILKKLSPIERAKAEKYYLVRYYNYHLNQKPDKQSQALLLSVYCDKQNKRGWGGARWRGINKKNFKHLIGTINKDILPEHEIAKMEMLEAIDNNDWDRAIEKLIFLSKEIPLSMDVLYFQIYLFSKFGDYENAIRMSNIAEVFYGKEDDIKNLIDIVYNEVSDEVII